MATSYSDIQSLTGQLSDLAKGLGDTGSSAEHTRNEMLAKAKQLIDSLIAPEEYVLQLSIQSMRVFAIRTIMKIGVLEALPREGSISLEDLSKKTGAQTSFIERLLRLLVGTMFINQDHKGHYSHTRHSIAFLGAPGDFLAGNLYDVILHTLVRYPEYLDQYPELVEPHSITHNPWTWSNGKEGTSTWDVLAMYPDKLARFQRSLAMMGPLNPVTGYYDFDDLSTTDDRPVFVDVGGGAGQCIVEILQAHPKLKPSQFILQDRPEVIELAKSNPRLPKEVVKMPVDFLANQPVKNSRAYYLRMIVHDYSDEVAIGILQNITTVMAKDSRLLLVDTVMPDRVGEASLPAATFDMFMLTIGGKERTAAGFKKILDAAGLKLEKIWRHEGTFQAVVEAVLA